MKKFLVVMVVMAFAVTMFGCGKKETAMEETNEPMTMEALSTMNVAQVSPAVKATETVAQVAQTATTQASQLAALPPAGPYKPTGQDIQTALKNAGFYAGTVDGKIGPVTKKAIEAFQNANGLQADGKVGPKTWAALSKYLNPTVATTVTEQKR